MTHVHKYYRINIGEKRPYIVFKCAIPSCTHYLTKKLALGKLSICWRCARTFQLSKRLMLKKPHCNECTHTKKEKPQKVEEFLEAIGLE